MDKKKLNKYFITISTILVTIIVLYLLFYYIYKPSYAISQANIVFSDSGISASEDGSGYNIDNTTLTIISNGIYQITGNANEGNIIVDKNLTNVKLVFIDLDLTSQSTAPLVIKKGSNVYVELHNDSTLTDDEDENLDGVDSTFEGAAIKVKTGSSIYFNGDGVLYINGNAKNGIKGAAESNFTMDEGNLIITSANNGIAFDNSILINGGYININSINDGIKAVPNEEDAISLGNILVNNGQIVIGSLVGDGIEASNNLTIKNGIFNITTYEGYNTPDFDENEISAKGIKISGSNNSLIDISGGTFYLNTRDDAIHSDGSVTITGGTFDINTGDDGIHADTMITLGTQDGLDRDPEVNILNSYEGLEAGTIYINSGKYYIVATDDGINAAGGSSNGTDLGHGSENHFNPGSNDNHSYAIYINGGKTYIDALGDGIDSNGSIYLNGGVVSVFSQGLGGDNSPLDANGPIFINGATIFATGTNPMNQKPSATSQAYFESKTSRSADTILDVMINNNVVYSDTLLRNVNYILYSSPVVNENNTSLANASEINECKGNTWNLEWYEGEIIQKATNERTGIKSYTAESCGLIELKTIPKTFNIDGNEEDDDIDENYTATFNLDNHTKVNVYYTQNYSEVSESNVALAIARNSDTGEADITGEGQINYEIILDPGYEIDTITITGSYKNNRKIDSTNTNLYRITKISSDLNVEIKTIKAAEDITITNNENYTLVTIDKLHQFTYQKLIDNLEYEYETISVIDKDGNQINDITATIGTGYQLTLNDIEYTIIVLGDIDSNGISDINDAKELAKSIIDKNNLPEAYVIAGDFTGDNIIKMNDVMKLLNR